MTDSTVPIAVCDDHEVYRRELMTALESDSDIQVVAEADVPSGLGPIVNEFPPHVIVVDLSPPNGDLSQMISTLAERMPTSQILAVGGPNDDLAAALIAGAVGAVEKTTALAMGPFIVHAVAAGRLFLDRRAAQSLLRSVHAHPRRTSIPANQVELVDRLTQVETIAELGRDSFTGARNERELVALLATMRARRSSDR